MDRMKTFILSLTLLVGRLALAGALVTPIAAFASAAFAHYALALTFAWLFPAFLLTIAASFLAHDVFTETL